VDAGVLRERPFRLVFGAQVVSLVGDGILPVALAFAVLDLTGSATDLGLVLAARTGRSWRACWPAAWWPTGARTGA
jgi:hypothetical protein